MLANLSDLVSVINAQGHLTYVSPSATRLVGRRVDDRFGASILDFAHPDDVQMAADRLQGAIAQPGLVDPFEARLLHEDGTYRTFEVCASSLLDDPAVQGIIVNSRDITDRVTAEHAPHESERLYRTIVETADEGIWIVDENSVTTFVNGRIADMSGTTIDGMVGRHSFEFLDDDDPEFATRNLEQRRVGIGDQHDVRLVRADGSTFWGMVTATSFIDQDEAYEGTIALVTDIRNRLQTEADLRAAELARARHEGELERHRLEAEIHQTRRLESLGRLAAGVAHDFNNLVGVILNYATVAARHIDASNPAASDMVHIRRAAEQAADVTRKLLTFGRADPVHPEIFDLNELIKSVTRLVDRSFGGGITVTTRLASAGCFIEADSGQIEQLLMNLLLNARDAVGNSGAITVTTTYIEAPHSSAATNGGDIVVTVMDDGIGMPPHVLDRAFEPFFTTKPAERGTGLGLATVHAIVDRSNGHITITSEPAVGTTILVRLPTSTSTAARAVPPE